MGKKKTDKKPVLVKKNKQNIKKPDSIKKDNVKNKKTDYTQKSLLEVKGLTKYFGIKAAVKNASFSMEQGEIVGLLGPNGAGKTTIFYMIVGFLNPTFGNIYMNNHWGVYYGE